MTTVRPIRESDREAAGAIVAAHLDEGWSYDLPENDTDAGTFVRVAESDGDVVGVMALSTYTEAAAVRDAMHLFDTADPLPTAPRYGLVHAGYVAPDRTGEGVGSRLLERLHTVGAERGVATFVADAWFHGAPDSPAGLLAGHGYEVVHTRPIRDHTDGPCPKCGEPCVCAAALAVRPVNG